MTALALASKGSPLGTARTPIDEPLRELPAGKMVETLWAVGVGATQMAYDALAPSRGLLGWLGGTMMFGVAPIERPQLNYLENQFRHEHRTPITIVATDFSVLDATSVGRYLPVALVVAPKKPAVFGGGKPMVGLLNVNAPIPKFVGALTVAEPDPVVLEPDVVPVAEVEAPPAYRAYEELRNWLGMTAAEVADMIGVGRTTPYTWLRQRCEPQPTTSRRLYQVHSIIDALRNRLGEAETRVWLEGGNPSPVEVLRESGHEGLMRLAHDLLFRRPIEAGPLPGSFIPEEQEATAVQARAAQSAQVRKIEPRVARRRR